MANRADDGELVRRTLAGERDAFAELVGRYRDAVFGLAYHYLGNFEEAQDAAQEAFVRAYLRLKQLRDAEKFGPWLRRIAASICADFLRRRGDRLVSAEEVEEQAAASPGPSRDEDVERLAARMVVRDALGRLSEKMRLTTTLFYINGYTHSEIAEFLDVPVNTVRSRLQRARKQLREEMTAMVGDVLKESRPDPEFTRQVVEEAMKRGEDAHKAQRPLEAIRHYDEALAAVEKMEPGPERQHLKMEALMRKGSAVGIPRGWEEALRLYEQALAIAEELADRKEQANMITHIGVTYARMRQPEKAEAHYEKALKIYQDLGDPAGQGQCLLWLGSQRMPAKEPAAGKPYYERALPMFEEAKAHEWAAVCRAMLDVLAEVGEERFRTLLGWAAASDGLRKEGGTVAFFSQPGSSGSTHSDEMPAGLLITSIFWQIARLPKFLDTSVAVGVSWSGDAFSYSFQPLQASAAVKSASERVTVPAGSFERCLLMEYETKESGLPDDGSERQRKLNRKFLCGTRRAWYAPGVGLVQLEVKSAAGTEGLIQLKEFSVTGGGDDYLPLAVGNWWTYGWANVPPEYVAKEFYRVLANEGDLWYLEHYHYLYRE